MEYYSTSYSVGDPANKKQDFAKSYFSLYQPPNAPFEVYRVKLDSVHVRKDSLESYVSYKYDTLSGLPVATRTRHVEIGRAILDSVQYAYTVNSSMSSDNQLTAPVRTMRFYDTAGVKRPLSKNETEWIRKGSWKPSKTYAWRDVANDATKYATFELLPGDSGFDAYGNVLVSKSADGTYSSVKMDGSGTAAVASAANCRPEELLVQEFEQGPTWDQWVLPLDAYDTLVTDALTGTKAFRMLDNPGSSLPNLGPSRKIHKSKFTDTLFVFSAWVKSNEAVMVYCQGLNSSGDTISGGTVSLSFPTTDLTWRQVQGRFSLKQVLQLSGLDSVRFQVALNNGTDKAATFDAIRFHPINATGSSTIGNHVTGEVFASSGTSNTPAKTQFDALHRPTHTRRFDEFLLVGTTYFNSEIRDTLVLVTSAGAGPDLLVEDSMIVDIDQTVSYALHINSGDDQCPSSAEVYKWVSQQWALQYGVNCNPPGYGCSGDATGSFHVVPGDKILIRLTRTEPCSEFSAYAKVFFDRYGANPTEPSYVKTTTYQTTTDSTVSVAFSDGFGRNVQTRSEITMDGITKTLVSGPDSLDARGRPFKSYLPYADIVAPSGLMDYSTTGASVSEVLNYYDGDPGVDTDSLPFSESIYSEGVNSKLLKTSLPGPDLSIESGHVRQYDGFSRTAAAEVVGAVTDEDNQADTVVADQWGRWSKTLKRFTNSLNQADSIETKTWKNLLGQVDSVTIDTFGPSRMKLRSATYNSLGQETSTSKVDYGTIRMLYDKSGNLRFMQNDKRKLENKFVYFRYDKLGRKTEEGIVTGDFYFAQSLADTMVFPNAELLQSGSYVVTYRWYYDFYKNNTDSMHAPGRLVRVQNSDSSYYRNFYYYPEGDSDKVIVQLPVGVRKCLKHFYHRDGSLKRLQVYPNANSTAGMRTFDYLYTPTGELRAVVNPIQYSSDNNLAEYDRNADGSLKQLRLGVHSYLDPICENEINDTVQVVDYQYDPTGRLTAINVTDSVRGAMTGGGFGNDHFGQRLTHYTDTSGYYNGRIWQSRTANSSQYGLMKHCPVYTYNELGWLTAVDDTLTQFDQRFYYDALGRRAAVKTGASDSVTYTYYTDTPGSSRLSRISSMPANTRMVYDTLGNLIRDSSRSLFNLIYDYRNLLGVATVAPTNGPLNSTLTIGYDESGMRIRKKFDYRAYGPCDDDSIPNWIVTPPGDSGFLESSMAVGEPGVMEGSGGGGECLKWFASGTQYLYDNGVLVATFDERDSVLEMFANGPQGKIAVWHQNKDAYLYYFVPDYLGSTRLVMSPTKVNWDCSVVQPAVAQYYNYWSYGEIQQSYGSYNSPYQWTGKEHDVHSTFDLQYFGARYYDPRIGAFTSVDKASQFANGFVYGGNNPVMGVDRDGNWFGVDDLIAAAIGFTTNFVSTFFTTGELDKAFGQGLVGAGAAWVAYNTGGMAAGLVSKPGRAAYAITASTVGGGVGGAIGGVGSQYVYNGSFKGFSWDLVGRSTVSGLAGGLAGGFAGQYITSDPVMTSMIGGGVGGLVEGAYAHDMARGFGQGAAMGVVGGIATVAAYDIRGSRIPNKTFGESVYGKDISRLSGEDRSALYQLAVELGKGTIEPSLYLELATALVKAAPDYSCKDFASDFSAFGKEVVFGTPNWGKATHVGVDIGGDLYGHRYILSKHGQQGPILINTLRQLSSGTWIRSIPPPNNFITKYTPASVAYGAAYYVW